MENLKACAVMTSWGSFLWIASNYEIHENLNLSKFTTRMVLDSGLSLCVFLIHDETFVVS